MMPDPRGLIFRLVDALLLRVRRWNYRVNYLKTRHWQETREKAIALAGGCCHECGNTRGLEVHHKTYAHLGDEQPQDLEVLCGYCHAERHALANAKKKVKYA